MNGSRAKKPRTMRADEVLPEWYRLQESAKIAEEKEVKKARKLSNDPVQFFRQVVGFEPTNYQKDLIQKFLDHQFIAARWCRQSGKSWIVAALLLWYGVTHADSHIGIVAPSLRQAKFIIRKISVFLKRLPPGMYLKPMRTVIRLTNGSQIEAFPCSPETIRGPTLNVVYADEWNFVPNDEEMYDSILFTLGSTNGKFICSSTPWSTDSIFYKIFNHKDFEDFAKSHVTWEQAVEPNGPLKKTILEKIRKQLAEDPWRWQREMMAQFSEDEACWLPQSLIVKSIGTEKTCGEDLEAFNPEQQHRGNFYAGMDFGKHGDYSVLSIIEDTHNKLFLRFLKIWQLETSYASIIGYVKTLQDRSDGFVKLRADQTGIGDYIVEDMKNSGINNVDGVQFSHARKQEMASLLKQRLIEGKLFYPYLTWEKPYSGQLVTELNVERFQLKKDGSIGFSHPQGTHDDVFWSVALALYATVEMKPLDLEAFKFG